MEGRLNMEGVCKRDIQGDWFSRKNKGAKQRDRFRIQGTLVSETD